MREHDAARPFDSESSARRSVHARSMGQARPAPPSTSRSDHDATARSSSHPAARSLARRLALRGRIILLFITLLLLSGGAITALAYLGANAAATATAQATATQDTQVMRQLLNDQGPAVTLQDGKLRIGIDNAALVLNGDTTFVDRVRALVNADATIYQLEGPRLVAITTTLTDANTHSRDLGDDLSGAPATALLGDCGAVETPHCHHAYSGVLTIHGVSYIAAFAPLTDSAGAFVGALSVATPLERALAPDRSYAVMLILVALLVALLAGALSWWAFGPLCEPALQRLDQHLTNIAASAASLEHHVHVQSERAGRYGRVARHVNENARALSSVARTMEHGEATLRESAGAIWGEVSQPGAAPDVETALRWARGAAVASAQVGASASVARERSQHLIGLMNSLIAEADHEVSGGEALRVEAQRLRESIERIEMIIGDKLLDRPEGLGNLPLLRRITPISRRLRSILSGRRLAISRARVAAVSQRRPGARPRSSGRSSVIPNTNSSQRAPIKSATQPPQTRRDQTSPWRAQPGDARPSASQSGYNHPPTNADDMLYGLGLPNLPDESASSWRHMLPPDDQRDDAPHNGEW